MPRERRETSDDKLSVGVCRKSWTSGLTYPNSVVLGGDTTFALPLIQGLERKGYIVIASVSNPEACAALESQCQGYVRALVLDPSEVRGIPHVLVNILQYCSQPLPTHIYVL